MAESRSLRSLHGRPTLFNPLEMDPVIGSGAVPAHGYAPLGARERTVLGGIGRKLMQRKADVLRGIGAEKQRRPFDARARARAGSRRASTLRGVNAAATSFLSRV